MKWRGMCGVAGSLCTALLVAACTAPQGRITSARDTAPPAGMAHGAAAGADGARAAAPARTVDAIPVDDSRRAFEALPATRGANRQLAAAQRPAPAPVVRTVAPVSDADGVVVAAAPGDAAAGFATLPAPSIPAQRVRDEAGTPDADEGALLRGTTRERTPPPTPDPVRPPEPEPEPAPAPPAPSVPAPPSPAAPEPAPPAAPPVPAPAPPSQPDPLPPPAPAPSPAPPPPAGAGSPAFIEHLTLATRVRGFGDYTAIAPAVLAAGERVIVYFELVHWTGLQRQDGNLVTEATYAVQVLDADGTPVWSDAPQRAKDISRTKRDDLFVTRLVTLPGTLTPGMYALRVVAHDTATGAQAVASVPFEISAPPST